MHDKPDSKQYPLNVCRVVVVIYVYRICVGGVDVFMNYMGGEEAMSHILLRLIQSRSQHNRDSRMDQW